MDIKIKELEYNKTIDLTYSNLKLMFNGKDISNIIINSIRRVILEDIPTYAFSPDVITIEKNTTIFNNDQLKLRLSQIPIYNIDNGIDYLEDKFWKNVNYNDIEREKHKNEKSIKFYAKCENNISENILIKNITTNDINYFINDEKIEQPYNKKYPILVTKLNQCCEFSCNLNAVLGVGKKNVIWSPVSNVYYTIDDKNNITLNIHSNGQITEYNILMKACKNINHQLETIKKYIKENISFETDEIIFNLESLTIGNIINEKLQKHKNIKYSGVSKPSYLDDKVIIKIKTNEKIKIDNILDECIDECIKIYDTIYNIIKKMNK
jgi:DNA-directed RNA polymerase subunit L